MMRYDSSPSSPPHVERRLQFPSLVLGGVDDLLDLDERWFSTLGGMDEQGPALVIWAVSLCLSYQILESNPHRQTDVQLVFMDVVVASA